MTLAEILSTTPQGDHASQTYWTEMEVLSGKLIMMPTMRLARLHRIEPYGKRVFVTPQSKLLCEHGECPSTILSWINREAHAAAAGVMAPKRSSSCNCLNTNGLYYPRRGSIEPPASPPSLFTYLERLNTHKSIVNGRIARHVPHTHGSRAMYLTQKGHFVCCHHHTLATIRKMRKVRAGHGAGTEPATKFRGGECNCDLNNLPQRNGLKMLPRSAHSELPGKCGAELISYRELDALLCHFFSIPK